MRRLLAAIVLLTACVPCFSGTQEQRNFVISELQKAGIHPEEVSDTVINYDGFSVKIIHSGDSVSHIGLNLFSPEWKDFMGTEMIDFIEDALLYAVMEGKPAEDSNIEITNGKISDFREIGPATPCNILNTNAKALNVEWTLEDGNLVAIAFPVSYETIRKGSRSEIENSFISKLKAPTTPRKKIADFDLSVLEPYGETEYVLPGPHYINKQIARNIYLSSVNPPVAIWNINRPLESISNLFSCTPKGGDTEVDLTILKHEYGEQELLTTTIETLLAVAEAEGCVPYWGMESYNDGNLSGSLFLYNPQQGYDHVLKVECIPQDIIEGTGKIKARASLYVPTNNVRSLDEPYRIKTENEKIKYK